MSKTESLFAENFPNIKPDIILFVVANDLVVCLFIFQSEDDDSASVTTSSITVSVCVCVSQQLRASLSTHTGLKQISSPPPTHVPMAMSRNRCGPDRLLIGCDGLPLLSDWNQQESLL